MREHHKFGVSEWRTAISKGETIENYQDWVRDQVKSEAESWMFTEQELNVQLEVTARFSVNLCLYDGPITKRMIADYIDSMIDGDIDPWIDTVTIEALDLNDNGSIVWTS